MRRFARRAPPQVPRGRVARQPRRPGLHRSARSNASRPATTLLPMSRSLRRARTGQTSPAAPQEPFQTPRRPETGCIASSSNWRTSRSISSGRSLRPAAQPAREGPTAIARPADEPQTTSPALPRTAELLVEDWPGLGPGLETLEFGAGLLPDANLSESSCRTRSLTSWRRRDPDSHLTGLRWPTPWPQEKPPHEKAANRHRRSVESTQSPSCCSTAVARGQRLLSLPGPSLNAIRTLIPLLLALTWGGVEVPYSRPVCRLCPVDRMSSG